jgi:hypothetical protein
MESVLLLHVRSDASADFTFSHRASQILEDRDCERIDCDALFCTQGSHIRLSQSG